MIYQRNLFLIVLILTLIVLSGWAQWVQTSAPGESGSSEIALIEPEAGVHSEVHSMLTSVKLINRVTSSLGSPSRTTTTTTYDTFDHLQVEPIYSTFSIKKPTPEHF